MYTVNTRKTKELGICREQKQGLNLTLYYVCKWHLGIRSVFQKQHFPYVSFFLGQSIALYFFQYQVQMAQPGIQGSPQVFGLLCQYFPTWTLNSTQAEVHTITQTQNEHCFLGSLVCILCLRVKFPSSSPLPLINPPILQYTLHLNKAMSMIRSHPLVSLIFWIVLFYTLSYFVYYSLRKY